MTHPTFAELLRQLNESDEHDRIEAKRGSAIGQSAPTTISAFSNTPGLEGGYLVLGVEKDAGALPGLGGYRVSGLTDPDRVQQELVSVCQGKFNEPLRPEIRLEIYEDKPVLVVYVPEFAPERKPIFLRKEGLPNGAFMRLGSADVRCNNDDLAALFGARGGKTYDAETLPDAEMSDLDLDAIGAYRRRRAGIKADAVELEEDDEGLLRTLNCAAMVGARLRPTVAGLLLFGKRVALRRLMPTHRIEYIVVPGRAWSEGLVERLESSDFLESLVTALPRIESLVSGDLPRTTELPREGIVAHIASALPERVLREAIVNAAMHRDYRTASATQIVRYANRLEIQNAGYSLKSPDRWLEPRSVARNPVIAEVLRDLNLAEAKGTGIGRMTKAMAGANLTEPIIATDRAEARFSLTLFLHNLMTEEDVAWLARFADCELSPEDAKVLVLARQLGAVSNRMVRDATGLDTLVASRLLKRLLDLELLTVEGKGSATVYRPGPRLLAEPLPSEGNSGSSEGELPPNGGSLGRGLPPYGGGLGVLGGEVAPLGEELPSDLRERIRELGTRAPKRAVVEEIILALVAIRPMTGGEIARTLDRARPKLQENYLGPMVRSGWLRRLRIEPSHPYQRYAPGEKAGDPHGTRSQE